MTTAPGMGSSQIGPAVVGSAAADATEEETRATTRGETVGEGERAADYASSVGEALPADAPRDDDSVPVGEADRIEDMRRSGADVDTD